MSARYDMIELNIVAHYKGDPAVGIESATWEIPCVIIENDEHREDVRKAFASAFAVLTGEQVSIVFDELTN